MSSMSSMSPAREVHLVFLIHGLWGSPSHLFAAEEELEKEWTRRHGAVDKATAVSGPDEDPTIKTKLNNDPNGSLSSENGHSDGHAGNDDDEELVVVIAGGMTSQLTYDGIDVCASRVAWEVDQQIASLEAEGKKVTKFSVTGYSLGGLVARYLIGLLDSRSPSFFDQHQPTTFSTIATPHLGIPKYSTFLSTTLVWLGSKMLSRSGEQLYVTDRYSDEDSRPLLEIMADPNLVFSHALGQFKTIQIFANAVNDHTVPYPSAAIETTDHFLEWDARGLSVNVDEGDIITDWSAPPPDEVKPKKKSWGISMGTLPPVLRYRFPFNYLIILLFPIMLPLVIILMMSRLALDTRRSQKRLQQLARTATSPSSTSPSSSEHSASGLSVQSLRAAIRRVERGLESDLISALDSPELELRPSLSQPHRGSETKVKVLLKDSQLRMALWLNKLPLKKYVTWYPDVANAHSVSIVRDPKGFPAHDRGRGLLRRWAKGVLGHVE